MEYLLLLTIGACRTQSDLNSALFACHLQDQFLLFRNFGRQLSGVSTSSTDLETLPFFHKAGDLSSFMEVFQFIVFSFVPREPVSRDSRKVLGARTAVV